MVYNMTKIQELKAKIEATREEVSKSLEMGLYDVSYEKNLLLDKLIENYLDALEELTTKNHKTPPPDTTIE